MNEPHKYRATDKMSDLICDNYSLYFLDFKLPVIRRKLIESIDCSGSDNIAYLILKFFDEYAKEVRRHMEYENEAVFTYVEKLLEGKLAENYDIATFASKHNQIESKLTELKNIIIKYYPEKENNNKLNAVLFDIFNCEHDLASHCQVEDYMFVPAVAQLNNNVSVKIAVAETSVIIRSGLTTVLKRLPNLNVVPIEVSSPESLQSYIHLHTPDVLIVNPTFGGWFNLPAFKAENGKVETKYLALVCSVIDSNSLKEYDDHLSICDDPETIATKINQLLCTDEEEEKENEQETLSQREKEIITCVVKGMTNKAIADQLYLSIHTVITHRRNIARKLQIHSPAGLTIYAIVNKLVELQDIKDNL